MRGCLALLGLVVLAVGLGILFYVLAIPRLLTAEKVLGGASITQQQIVEGAFGSDYTAENPPDLPVTVDGEPATTNSLNALPDFEGDAFSDASSLEGDEAQASAEIAQEQVSALANADVLPESASLLTQNDLISEGDDVEVVPLRVQNAVTPNTSLGQGGASGISSVEQRVVELEWPSSFRVGGSAPVRLTLRALEGGGLEAVPEIPDNAIVATPILLSDLYSTHSANFTARLVAPDFTVETLTPDIQTLNRGEEATWRWNLKAPENSGRFVITMVIEVTWFPVSSGVQVGPRSVWGQSLQVDVNYVFGSVTVPQASYLGGALSVFGFFAQFPWFWVAVERVTARRRRRTAARRSSTRSRRR